MHAIVLRCQFLATVLVIQKINTKFKNSLFYFCTIHTKVVELTALGEISIIIFTIFWVSLRTKSLKKKSVF